MDSQKLQKLIFSGLIPLPLQIATSPLPPTEGSIVSESSSTYDLEDLYTNIAAQSESQDFAEGKFYTESPDDTTSALFSDEAAGSLIDETIFNVRIVPVKHRSGNPKLDNLLSKYNLEPHVSLLKLERKDTGGSTADDVVTEEESLLVFTKPQGRSVADTQEKAPPRDVTVVEEIPVDNEAEYATPQVVETMAEPVVVEKLVEEEEVNLAEERRRKRPTISSRRREHRRLFGRLSSLDSKRREDIIAKRQKIKSRRQNLSNREVFLTSFKLKVLTILKIILKCYKI